MSSQSRSSSTSSLSEPRYRGIPALVRRVKEILLTPVYLATSKFALRAYLTSILFVGTSFLLLLLAVFAYALFYYTYMPRIGFTKTVHLQFDHLAAPSVSSTLAAAVPLSSSTSANDAASSHPWGVVQLQNDLVSQQQYDITITLRLPRTPINTAMGNFMLDATLLGPSETRLTPDPTTLLTLTPQSPVLARSRRAAILTYYSREVDYLHKFLQLPLLLTGLRHEDETLRVPVFEKVEFARGWRNIPTTLRLELQHPGVHAGTKMQVYECSVEVVARLSGLRWLMWNHRVLSACVFISAFWGTAVVATGCAWLVLSLFIFAGPAEDARMSRAAVKQEEQEAEEEDDDEDRKPTLSDTERTYPSYGSRAPALRYPTPQSPPPPDSIEAQQRQQQQGRNKRASDASTPYIKREEDADNDAMEPFPALYSTTAAAADDEQDEDEDDDFVLDSGLGTSLESSAGGRGALRREDSLRRRKKSGRSGGGGGGADD